MIRTMLMLLGLLAMLAGPSAAHADQLGAHHLSYATEDYYPYNYTRDGAILGYSVELLRRMWDEMGVPEQDIAVYPWARAYNGALNIPHTVTFSMARTPQREGLFKWAGPIDTVRFVLFAPAGSELAATLPVKLDGLDIGTVRDDVAETAVREIAPDARIESVSDVRQNLSKLLAGRLDLVAYEERSMRRLLAEQGLDPDALTPVYLLKETEIAFAFHLSTPDALVARFQHALDAVRARPGHGALVRRYFD